MPRATAAVRAQPAVAVGRAATSPLTFEVECLTSRTARRGPSHPVTLHPDGVLETPHDLAAERVAVAFGGFCSCLELVELAPHILAEVVGLVTRRTRPPLRRRPDGRWVVGRLKACDCPATFRSAAEAAAHARTARHLAARHQSSERVVRSVLDGLEKVLVAVPTDDDGAVAARVRESGGLAVLWAAGVHPDDVLASSRLAAVVPEPLPVAYYLGLAYGAPDHRFLSEALVGRPDADTAAWLAWLPAEGRDGAHARALLAAGLPRADVLALLSAGVDADRLAALGSESGLGADVVARQLAVWARAGCWPEGGHLRVLASNGLTATSPSAAALDRLVADAAALTALGEPPSRTELAVMAAIVGGRVGVLEALGRGITICCLC